MLLEINISDFAIIERLHLRLGAGFNVLTGETGAGKSIIIDALGTLRGERTDPTFVRAGATRARVEGIFSIADRADLIPVLEEYGLWDGEDEQVILSREIHSESGRSVARVNGRAVNSAALREIGGRLVDIHGQHEGLSLFNTRTHGEMLDRYGGLLPLREQVAEQVAALRRVRDDLAALRKAAATRTERIQELRYLLEDVGAAKLRPGEEADLLQERALVQNGARITDLVSSAYTLLYAGEEGGRHPVRPIVEALGSVCDALAELAKIDPSLARVAEQASELLYGAEDLATGVRDYRDAMEFDPARLDTIEDRLTLIREMQRRFHGSIEQILERSASAEAEIERLAHSDEHMAELEAHESGLLAKVGALAGELSRRRRAVGDQLAEAVAGAMRDLAMPHVRFAVALEHQEDPQGVPVEIENEELKIEKESDKAHGTILNSQFSILDSRTLAFDKTGIDKIEFLLSPNPGEPLKPLARIASGGESARLLLALKSILSKVDEVPTLIFDEVDVGVGGRAGQVVGEKLWGISEQHQVICITHLPQVAAFGDAHFAIAKLFSGDRTRTTIEQLEDETRIDELAAMLDGTPISEHSRRGAQEMLDRAQTFKANGRTASREPALAR
ncbi:MAG TPA: DNA repair protein RecN [Roseiflexaceae bacterium]|nr:DNA repair protein RecN [Roseiflexaceae bacterium]